MPDDLTAYVVALRAALREARTLLIDVVPARELGARIDDLLAEPVTPPQGDGDDGSLYEVMRRGGNHLTGTGIQKL